MGKQICAIIPAYKEAKRIREVLIPLSKSKVNEIIIVDDGSKDDIEKVVRDFKVKLIKNPKNSGKAYCLDMGVLNTSAEIILFCDADLKDLTPEIINKIIRPVLGGKVEMFIGLRDTWSNRKGIGLLSGLRVIRRGLWERLPKFYKKGFRVEVGLNCYVEDFSYKIFDYNQVVKEQKYGVVWGWYRRLFMYWDVFLAWVVGGIRNRVPYPIAPQKP